MTSDAERTPIVVRLLNDAPDLPKQQVHLFLSKRNADAIRKTARLKGITQGDLLDDALTQYFQSLKRSKETQSEIREKFL
ncbi:MAG TPA: hypothetical protein VGK23_05660 [Methanomassiliicoccales archaeon]|jgi:hypothetical protein